MSSPLTNLYISDTYTGLLHAGGVPLSVAGTSPMYDGSGQQSALSLGVLGQGAGISGPLSASSLKVGTLNYASTPGALGSVAFMADSNTIGFSTDLPGSILQDIITPKTYVNIKSITVTAQGLVDDIQENDDINTITQTTYVDKPTASSNTDTVVLATNGSWAVADFGGTLVGYKAAIVYMEPTGGPESDQKWYKVDASPDQLRVFPVSLDWGGQRDNRDNEPFIGARQFTCPCSPTGLIYFRYNSTDGPSGATASGNIVTWRLNIIAKLK